VDGPADNGKASQVHVLFSGTKKWNLNPKNITKDKPVCSARI